MNVVTCDSDSDSEIDEEEIEFSDDDSSINEGPVILEETFYDAVQNNNSNENEDFDEWLDYDSQCSSDDEKDDENEDTDPEEEYRKIFLEVQNNNQNLPHLQDGKKKRGQEKSKGGDDDDSDDDTMSTIDASVESDIDLVTICSDDLSLPPLPSRGDRCFKPPDGFENMYHCSRTGEIFCDEEFNFGRNFVIPGDDLIGYFVRAFACRKCRKKVNKSQFRVFMRGTSVDILFTCRRCRYSQVHQVRLWSPTFPNPEHTEAKKKENKEKPMTAIEDYVLNMDFVLAMQRIGGGKTDANEVLGQMGISPKAFHRWSKAEETLGIDEIAMGKKIMEENLEKEIEATRKVNGDIGEKVGITCNLDTGWNKRGNGHSYDSPSSQCLAIGSLTNGIIEAECMSSICRKCSKNIKHDNPELCPKNHVGSAGSMEPSAAVRIVTRIWNTGKAYVKCFVADDDSSTRKVLQPKSIDTASGDKKGTGLLPPDHPIITPLADLLHRIKLIGKRWYGLAKKKVADCTFKNCEAGRMKRALSFAIYAHLTSTVEEMEAACWQCIEHYFGNHEKCGKWCPAKKYEGNPVELAKMVYRDKEKDEKVYTQVKDVVRPYFAHDKLKEMQHEHSTQKNESMNNAVAKTIPKGSNLSGTIAAKARVNATICINSVGLVGFIQRMAEVRGGRINHARMAYAVRTDKEFMKHEKQWRSYKYRVKRSKRRTAKQRKRLIKELKAYLQNLYYGKGVAMDGKEVKPKVEKRNNSTASLRRGTVVRGKKTEEEVFIGLSLDIVQHPNDRQRLPPRKRKKKKKKDDLDNSTITTNAASKEDGPPM